MILEVAILMKAGQVAEFEQAFAEAQVIIASMPGYISHQLQRCLESPNRYILLVSWNKLEDRTVGFWQSTQYQEWKSYGRIISMIRFPLLSIMSVFTVACKSGYL